MKKNEEELKKINAFIEALSYLFREFNLGKETETPVRQMLQDLGILPVKEGPVEGIKDLSERVSPVMRFVKRLDLQVLVTNGETKRKILEKEKEYLIKEISDKVLKENNEYEIKKKIKNLEETILKIQEMRQTQLLRNELKLWEKDNQEIKKEKKVILEKIESLEKKIKKEKKVKEIEGLRKKLTETKTECEEIKKKENGLDKTKKKIDKSMEENSKLLKKHKKSIHEFIESWEEARGNRKLDIIESGVSEIKGEGTRESKIQNIKIKDIKVFDETIQKKLIGKGIITVNDLLLLSSKQIEDLVKISGIGAVKLQKIKDFLISYKV